MNLKKKTIKYMDKNEDHGNGHRQMFMVNKFLLVLCCQISVYQLQSERKTVSSLKNNRSVGNIDQSLL